MSGLSFDLTDFRRIARGIGALDTQLPFALAGAMNAAAEIGRRALIDDTWPRHVEARNPNFLKAALTTKGERATKRRLRVVVYDKLGRASLRMHEVGGTKVPRGGALAVPSQAVASRRTAKGIPAGIRPRAVPRAAKLPGKFGGEVIYQQTGKYRKATVGAQKKAAKAGERAKGNDGRHLRLMYSLRSSVPIRGTVPFHADFERSIRRAFPREFRVAMRRAMSTALRK